MRRLATHVEEVLAGALLGVMAVLAFVNILARYLTRYSFAFTEEIEVAALVWITMLGAALGVRETAHLGFTMLRHLLPKPARQALAVSSSVVAIATVTALMWAGWREIRVQIALGTTSEAFAIPEWIYRRRCPWVARSSSSGCSRRSGRRSGAPDGVDRRPLVLRPLRPAAGDRDATASSPTRRSRRSSPPASSPG